MVLSARLIGRASLAGAVVLGLLLGSAPALAGADSARTARVPAAGSAADLATQQKLAERYAPVVRLVDSSGLCGVGEPFQPANVDVVLDNPDVALRGPWSGQNLVTVGPTAADLSSGLSRYNLDFPGNALSPGCSYADWAKEVQGAPTVYSHVVTQSSNPGQLALQYWFFYLYNDFNDKHEGDWEMIQVDFKADSASQALTTSPYETGYSQHEGAERARWGAAKLELVDGTHPVVYPALGSHANYYSARLFLGHSAAQGVGCDDTIGPSRSLRPNVVALPQSATQALKAFPWLGYQGRWGEKQRAFNNGPTGPSTKSRWAEPFTWVEHSWRDKAFAVPEGGLLGHGATSFFCSAVSHGSSIVNAALDDPSPVIVGLIIAVLLVVWLASRTEWGPAVTFRVRRRRTWGSMVSAAIKLYRSQPRTFGGIGLLFIPLGLIAAAVQYLIFDLGGLSSLVQIAGQTNPVVELLVEGLGLAFTLVGLTVVQAATAYAVSELDAERPITARTALRYSLSRWRNLLGALVIAGVVVAVLSLTIFGLVIAGYLVVRWSLLAQAVIVGGERHPLRHSFRITRRHFWRTASVTVFVTVLCLLIGPLIGTLLLFLTPMPFALVNAVTALVNAAISPLIAITTTYLYFDLEVRTSMEARQLEIGAVLPSEL